MRFKIIFMPVTILFLALFTQTAFASAFDAEETENVEKVLVAYRAAWMAGDKSKVLSTLSNEINLFVPGRANEILKGKQAVAEFWFPESDISYPIRKYDIASQEVFGGGDFATAIGKSELIWDTVEDGIVTSSTDSYSDFITILRKEDGHWRIYRQMYQMRDQ